MNCYGTVLWKRRRFFGYSGFVRAEELSRDERFCAGKAILFHLKLICETQYGEFAFQCGKIGLWANNEEKMPFDQHFLLAANAAHRVYVASAVEDLWSNPTNEYLACIAASDYYKANGKTGFIHPNHLPVAGDFFGEGHIGYHLRAGLHYLSREDWQHYIKYLNAAK